MNLSGVLKTLVDDVRAKLDDATPSEQRWSDEYIVSSLNIGEREVARRAYDLEDSTTAEICTITIATAIASYSLSTKVLFVKRVEFSYDGSLLNKRDEEWLDKNRSSWKTDTGLPTDFIERKSTMVLTPIPTVTYNGETLALTVVRLPLVDLSSTNVTPEVHSKYYDDMVTYACFECKLKRDADTFDPEGAMTSYKIFEDSVGPRTSGNIERIVKENSIGLRIGINRR